MRPHEQSAAEAPLRRQQRAARACQAPLPRRRQRRKRATGRPDPRSRSSDEARRRLERGRARPGRPRRGALERGAGPLFLPSPPPLSSKNASSLPPPPSSENRTSSSSPASSSSSSSARSTTAGSSQAASPPPSCCSATMLFFTLLSREGGREGEGRGGGRQPRDKSERANDKSAVSVAQGRCCGIAFRALMSSSGGGVRCAVLERPRGGRRRRGKAKGGRGGEGREGGGRGEGGARSPAPGAWLPAATPLTAYGQACAQSRLSRSNPRSASSTTPLLTRSRPTHRPHRGFSFRGD